jgi:hypothetical protein
VRKAVLWASEFWRQPELTYLELHLTDHCNLNCKGCTHYSPLAPPWYADLGQYESDMHRLRQLFRNIRIVRLMGGEPLPRARLRFVTNGLLLSEASPRFWEACRRTHTVIDLTVYPPWVGRIRAWQSLCITEGVCSFTRTVEMFLAHANLRGDSDQQTAFDLCRRRYFWPVLHRGRLYPCGVPAFLPYFNDQFGARIPADAGLDIHSPDARARTILRRLHRPMETCRWCSYDFVPFPWATSRRRPEEWDAAWHQETRTC